MDMINSIFGRFVCKMLVKMDYEHTRFVSRTLVSTFEVAVCLPVCPATQKHDNKEEEIY
jgi:hypothetical protein